MIQRHQISPADPGSAAPSPPCRPAWLEVDAAAIRRNVAAVQAWTGPGAGVMAVVKANAYGHGLVPAARAALAGGAEWLGVAIPEEALELRAAGIGTRILVMGACDPLAADCVVENDVDVSLSTMQLGAALDRAAARQGKPARVHVKVDTGMGRVGVSVEGAADFVDGARTRKGLEVAGVMTHFATADEEDLAFTREQWRRFQRVLFDLQKQGGVPPFVHAANSAAVCRFPESYAPLPDGARPLVRAGLLVYGVPPSPSGPCPALTPALALKARVTQVRNVPIGTTVSYGATFTTARPTRLALVSLGYADGYARANSGHAHILLRGRRAPVAGRVCMDQFVVDATDTGAEAGDEAVLLGRQGNEEITVNDLAAWGSTVHHEVLARLGARLPRIYRDDSEFSPQRHGGHGAGNGE